MGHYIMTPSVIGYSAITVQKHKAWYETMKPTPTYLRSLNNCLSGRSKKIFPNQVIFYNAVFGATNPALLSDEDLAEVERIGRGDRRPGDAELIKRINYLLRGGLDSNSANVGKHINNAQELPIPKQHKNHYLEGERSQIVRRLQVMVQFCMSFHPSRYQLDPKDFSDLLEQMQEELAGGSATLDAADELTEALLANVIYEIVMCHLGRLQERYYSFSENGQRVKIDLAAQREEFARKVDCYGTYNSDRFYAMERLAQTNVVAATELANVYYFGAQYRQVDEGDGNNGILRIEVDVNMAAKYYKKAIQSDPPEVSACWSLGYMLRRHMFEDVSPEESDQLAARYFHYALEQEYVPAYDSVGLMELAKANELFERERKLRQQHSGLPQEEWEEMLFYYGKGLELCDRAGCGGWVYGHINVAEYLSDPEFMEIIWPVLRDQIHLQGPINLRERWKMAADRNNFWAMNQLALLDWRSGNRRDAIALWEKAAGLRYPTANLNLALLVYAQGSYEADPEKYRLCLEQASADGSARASYELAKHYAGSNSFTARMLLDRAEEQNYRKFNNTLYHQIRSLRDTL